MNRLRIALICDEYPPAPHGGIGSNTRNLARGLAAAGHEVRVIGSYASEQPEYEEDMGVRVYRLRGSTFRPGWIQERMTLYRWIARWSRRGEIDLVELPDWRGWAAAWPALPVPVVVRLNGSATYFAAEAGRQVGWRTRWIERASIQRASHWISCSRYTADKTRTVFDLDTQPSAIIPNAVQLREHHPLSQRDPGRVLFSGTLTEKKGIISLIRAWPQVIEGWPDAHLEVYGKDGRYRDHDSMTAYLRNLIPAPIESTVRFLGHQRQEVLLEALEHARVAVFPSYAEAFALAPMEAMACGCPTIYSCRGSGPELIDHAFNGLLIDPDDPEEISSAIHRVLVDDQFAAEIAAGGWQRIRDRFCVAHVVEANVEFYQACIRDFHRGRRRQRPKARKASVG